MKNNPKVSWPVITGFLALALLGVSGRLATPEEVEPLVIRAGGTCCRQPVCGARCPLVMRSGGAYTGVGMKDVDIIEMMI